MMSFDQENQKLKQKIDFVIVWQWKDNDGTWKDYGDEMCKKIEQLQINKSFTFSCWVNLDDLKKARKIIYSKNQTIRPDIRPEGV